MVDAFRKKAEVYEEDIEGKGTMQSSVVNRHKKVSEKLKRKKDEHNRSNLNDKV